jgi:cytochrome c-type biogenesis protein CcmE
MDLAENRAMQAAMLKKPAASRTKFFLGGMMIFAAVVYLIVSSLQNSSQYFLTVDELKERGAEVVGRDVRISGAVIGESIQYDPETLTLRFTVAHMPGDQKEVDRLGGLAFVLHQAVTDPNAKRMDVVYIGVKPDLLRDEAQAIMTGKVDEARRIPCRRTPSEMPHQV